MTTLNLDVIYRDHGAERGMRNLGQTTDKTSGRFKGLKVAGAAALAAVGVAAVKFGADSVRAYVAAEGSQVRLQEAFRKFPKLADTNIGALNKLNTELARKTRFDDDATASGQAVLAQFNLTGKQITQLTPLLQDYAAKTGKDLPTAARDLGKAMMGQGRSLKAVGINFKDTGTQSGNLDQVMRGLRSQVGGFAEREGKTAAGQSEILKNQFGELQETAGQKLLPALLKIGSGLLKVITAVQDGSGVFGSFKRIVSATFGAFAEAIGGGHVSFRNFADFIETHQADITRGFVVGAQIVLELGKAFATMTEAGLRGAAMLMDAYADFTQFMFGSFRNISRAAVLAFGWIPGVGDRIKEADAKFGAFAETTVTGMRRAAAGARGAADGIDNRLRPALDKAGKKLDEVSRKEIIKAAARDAVNRASQAIRDLGTKTDGTQVKIKRFSDITRLSANEQRAFRQRLADTRQRMLEQREAGIRAGDSQKELTRRWNLGREALRREFIQMGLSKEEARKLSVRYSQVPKSVQVKHTTPGAQSARTGAAELRRRINEIPRQKTVTISFKSNASFKGFAVNLTAPSAVGRLRAGGPVQNLTGRGRPGADTEPILGEVDEHMLTRSDVRAMGGHGEVFKFRRALHMAEGGPVVRNVNVRHDRVGSFRNLRRAIGAHESGINKWAKLEGLRIGRSIRTQAAAAAAAAAGSAASWGGGGFRGLSSSQMGIAATIAQVGAPMGKKAQIIGIIAGLVESRLRNVNFGDRDSLGVFQQRAPWGPASVRRNVRASAGMFFHGGRGGQRGLDDIAGWQRMSAGAAAQRVQVSAFPGRYQTQVPLGLAILGALTARRGAGGNVAGFVSAPGNPRGIASFRGGRFTRLAIAHLRRVEQISGQTLRIMQGGWRPRTSYSGTSHAGDASDTQRTASVIRAFRSVGWASGDRTGLGNWGPHAHSIPGPGRGYARGSAVWQWGDYVRRGGSRQGLRSPWGLRDGGVMRNPALIGVSERGPERILSARQTHSFERMVRVMERGGGASGTSVTINMSAPNYVGSQQDLVDTMVQMAGRGQMSVVLRKAGVRV